MIYCRNCGNALDDNAKFCDKCGTATDKTVPLQPNEAPKAASVPVAAAPAYKPSFIEKIKGNKRARIIIAVVLALIAIAAAVMIISSVIDASRCDASGCKNAPAEGSSYCYSHKCATCSNRKLFTSKYCSVCKKKYEVSSSASSSNAVSDLKFSNIKVTHNSLYTVVTGTVTNKGTKTYKFVTVKGAFKDSTGKVVDTDSTYAVGSEGLAKGESKTFRMSISKNTKVKSCTVTITGYK